MTIVLDGDRPEPAVREQLASAALQSFTDREIVLACRSDAAADRCERLACALPAGCAQVVALAARAPGAWAALTASEAPVVVALAPGALLDGRYLAACLAALQAEQAPAAIADEAVPADPAELWRPVIGSTAPGTLAAGAVVARREALDLASAWAGGLAGPPWAELPSRVARVHEPLVLWRPGTRALPPEPPGGYRVTAIVSAFKSTRFLRGCLEDLVAQTLHARGALEIVVVNTGSPEDEGRIVHEFQARHGHVRYLTTDDPRSLYAAWNLGIGAARGACLTNANTDDRHRADALEVMADALDRRPDVALVYADQLYTAVENETFASTRSRRRRVWAPYSYATLRSHCMIGPQPMWRRALHERYGGFDERFVSAGDWEFWLRIGAAGERFLKVDDVLGLYYENPQGLELSRPESRAEAAAVRRRYGILPAEQGASTFTES